MSLAGVLSGGCPVGMVQLAVYGESRAKVQYKGTSEERRAFSYIMTFTAHRSCDDTKRQ